MYFRIWLHIQYSLEFRYKIDRIKDVYIEIKNLLIILLTDRQPWVQINTSVFLRRFQCLKTVIQLKFHYLAVKEKHFRSNLKYLFILNINLQSLHEFVFSQCLHCNTRYSESEKVWLKSRTIAVVSARLMWQKLQTVWALYSIKEELD